MLQRDNRNMNEILLNILPHLTPPTEDQDLLNQLTIHQLQDVSYITNVLPRDAFFANTLVPQDLHEAKLNQVWRYPPHMSFSFQVKKTGTEPKISIKAGFGVPRMLTYREYRRFGPNIANREVSGAISIDTPPDFTEVIISGNNYQMREDQTIHRRSIPPTFYLDEEDIEFTRLQTGQITIPIHINDNNIPIKRYDANSGNLLSSLRNGEVTESISITPDNPQDPEPRVATIHLINSGIKARLEIKATPGSVENHYWITVELINECHYTRRPPKENEWRLFCMISPYLIIKFRDLELLLEHQQHSERLAQELNEGQTRRAVEEHYYQMNGILTRSTIDPQTLIGTSFGVFDTLRQDPVYYDKVIANMIESNAALLSCINEPLKSIIIQHPDVLAKLKIVLLSIQSSFNVNTLYQYQWDAIQKRLLILLTGEKGTTTIIKAPTGTGKTVVFMANAALHYLITSERAALVFPTRILNEDMFKRLTHFVYQLRHNGAEISGGIYIGSSDPLYKAVAYPEPGRPMIQFSNCPACQNQGSVVATQYGPRTIGQCQLCQHKIEYMYGVREVGDYLPSLTIATPDKIFYDITAAGYETFNLRFIGGKYAKCSCGACVPESARGYYICRKCNTELHPQELISSPLGYFVFDEVHSLYGMTGTLLSIFLKTLALMADKIHYPQYRGIDVKTQFTFETGTATIGNENELLTAITRVHPDNIIAVPDHKCYLANFTLNERRVKYRTLAILPIATSARSSVSRAIYSQFNNLHHNMINKPRLINLIQGIGGVGTEYDFILGYVFRKRDGYSLARSINDLARFGLKINLRASFLSGDSSSHEIARVFAAALQGQIRVLVANMIISLGVDIKNLNNMISMGVAKSMTEHVQTAGRTGRGAVPGHVTLHLLPSFPRDMFVYENFHAILGDVAGYYDRFPIQPTNAYAAQIIFPNILKALLAAMSYNTYVLTAPSATRYFGANQTRRSVLLFDLLKVLRDETTPASVKHQIALDAQAQIERFLQMFAERTGGQQFIGKILAAQNELLYTLREGSDKAINVAVTDTDLYQEMERMSHRESRGPYAPVDLEEIDEEAED